MGHRGVRSGRTFLSAAVSALLVLGLPGLASAVVVGTTTTLSVTPNSWNYGSQPTWVSTVTANGPADGTDPYGTVNFYDTTNAGHTWIGTGTVSQGSTAVVLGTTSWFAPGAHTFRAEFTSSNAAYSSSNSTDFGVTVGAAPIDISLSIATTTEQHSQLMITVNHTAQLDTHGSIDVYQVGSGTPVCTFADVEVEGSPVGCQFQANTLGTFTYYATFTTFDANLVSSGTSANAATTVVADVAHGHGVTVQYTTFYPVVDTYRDTVAIKGYCDEVMTASIKFYNSANSLVRSVTLPSCAGLFSYAWNGKNSSAVLQPEGTYKIVVKLTDAYANSVSFTKSVALSKKHLIWHSSSVSKLGSSLTASGHFGAGTVSISTTYGYARLYAPVGYSDWAGAGWQLTLPTAISYKYLTLKVDAKAHFYAGQDVRLGAQNFSTCVYSSVWDESCFDSWHSIGNSTGSLTWYSTGSLTSVHRYSKTLRVMVSATGNPAVYIYKAQLTFQYSTLGY